MGDEQVMKVEIIKRETIKPCNETPQHLRNLPFSLFDQVTTYRYMGFVFFYTNSSKTASERTQRLKETLPKVLSLFYPLAGRLRDNNLSVECNDEGAEFVEAKSSSTISEILRRPDLNLLKKFLPGETEFTVGVDQYLLRVQITAFGCGGTAIGICLTHKMGDASSVKTFLKAWSEIARGEPVNSHPRFGEALTLLPPVSGLLSPVETHVGTEDYVMRRYVFEAAKIEALKSKSENSNFKPSRVEAISALLWRVAIRTSNVKEKSAWAQVVNLRNRVGSRLRDNDMGNMVMGYFTVNNGDIIDHITLVSKLKKGIEDLKEEFTKTDNYVELARKNFEAYARLTGNNEVMNISGEPPVKVTTDGTVGKIYTCTSLCRLGLYDIDFGWEKPIWVSRVGKAIKNLVVLIDSNEGHGIEAWISMREQDVDLVEADEELLAFASFNPSVI